MSIFKLDVNNHCYFKTYDCTFFTSESYYWNIIRISYFLQILPFLFVWSTLVLHLFVFIHRVLYSYSKQTIDIEKTSR